MNVQDTKINGLYPIKLLPHRVKFHVERPTWEAERLAAMYELVKPGQVVYDVGAEEGDFTALYRSWVGDDGVIVAIEPSTGYWPAIRATWEGNGFDDVPLCVTAFAGDKTYIPRESVHWTHERRLALSMDDDSGWPVASQGPVVPDVGFAMLNERQADIPGWTMDDLAYHLNEPPDHIVFDIEGAEWHAMTGCQRLCQEGGKRPMLWVSVHEPHMAEAYDRRMGDIIRLVISWDYSYRYLGTHGGEDFWLFRPEESA